jgi:hypothetical protein
LIQIHPSSTVTKKARPSNYTVTVIDNGEPGSGVDTFSIQTDEYANTFTLLSGGNIQIHSASINAQAEEQSTFQQTCHGQFFTGGGGL